MKYFAYKLLFPAAVLTALVAACSTDRITPFDFSKESFVDIDDTFFPEDLKKVPLKKSLTLSDSKLQFEDFTIVLQAQNMQFSNGTPVAYPFDASFVAYTKPSEYVYHQLSTVAGISPMTTNCIFTVAASKNGSDVVPKPFGSSYSVEYKYTSPNSNMRLYSGQNLVINGQKVINWISNFNSLSVMARPGSGGAASYYVIVPSLPRFGTLHVGRALTIPTSEAIQMGFDAKGVDISKLLLYIYVPETKSLVRVFDISKSIGMQQGKTAMILAFAKSTDGTYYSFIQDGTKLTAAANPVTIKLARTTLEQIKSRLQQIDTKYPF